VVDTVAAPRKRQRLESRARRTFELFLLTISLIVGVGIIGGCGVVLAVSSGAKATLLIPAVGALLVGIVYLATSMSRDVRILKQKLLEQERLSAKRDGE
jgi:amino acid transporter